MRIGVIGLGMMGMAISSNLLKAGFTVTGWNRDSEPRQVLLGLGGKPVDTVQQVFADSDVVISMLANDAVVTAVFLDSGLLDNLAEEVVHVNMATVSAACSQALADAHRRRQQHYVAAPVLGNSAMAQAAQLHVLASGPAALIEQLRPVFAAISQSLRVIGDQAPMANVAKIATNFLLGSAVEALAEAHALVAAHSIPAATYQEVIDNTLLGSPAYRLYGGKIAAAQYLPAAFKLSLAHKDMVLALDTAAAAGIELQLGEVVARRLALATDAGLADHDLAALGLRPAKTLGDL